MSTSHELGNAFPLLANEEDASVETANSKPLMQALGCF
jgi:hypothetical protein